MSPRISQTSNANTYQPRDDVYGAYDPSHFQTAGPNQHTQSPIVTGTSVLAAKFKDGVVIAADNLGMSDPEYPNYENAFTDWTV
jgi:20S proteasome alpha/beta subunit